MTLQDEYQVKLDTFCGPLDLLLYLIRRAEVDIHDIPIAKITDQYLQVLRQVEHVDIEAAGEFLVMAATLMEAKSRTLMPPEAQIDEDGVESVALQEIEVTPGAPADPRFELVRQLLEYQRYRLASEDLQLQRQAFALQFASQPYQAQDDQPAEPDPPVLELDDAHVYDLYEAYERIIASIDLTHLGDHRVKIDDTPAALYQEDLLERLRGADGRLTLHEAFEDRDRVQRLGMFLAMLELTRLRRIVVRQEDLLSDITVELNEDPAELEEVAEVEKVDKIETPTTETPPA
ncbi:MAG: segregation and condensation protein A [Planctomycetota bacterium]|jgi:segregation and condensation protein A